ncbi:hypothetical protein [Paenibacillus sp. FSL W8-0194]|uniref:hypothetical protein n=1 Tax=Paenibacillus sp. FSL W8-0194 TaxID=2921711 RepID=UPI0030DBDAB6
MLADIERKILRIFYNYSSGRRRMPSMRELIIKTGRSRQDIVRALASLENQGFIVWEDKQQTQSVLILKGWEDGYPARKKTATSSLDYWTQY